MAATKITISVPASLGAAIKAYELSPSAVCQPALRAAVEKAEGDANKIVVRTLDHSKPNPEQFESFHGSWLVDPDTDDAISEKNHSQYLEQIFDPAERWGVAVSAKGALIVYLRTAGQLNNEAHRGIANCHIPEDIRERAIEAAKKPGDGQVPVIEHDW
jgi:hypothetical protein